MDNVTHTLCGLVVAECVFLYHEWKNDEPWPQSVKRRVLVVSALASNLPDLDLVYVGITEGRLGYLLHHRGHTHTLLGVAVLTVLAAWLAQLGAWRIGKRKEPKQPEVASARRVVWFTAFASGALHLLMDWQNNYGVHPFWPWNNRWWYGDALFIVEPWLLLGLSAALLSAYRRWWARLLLLALQGLLVWVALTSGFSSTGLGVGLPVVAVVLDTVLWRAKRGVRVLAGGGLLLAISGLGHIAGALAQQRMQTALSTPKEGARTQWVRTPAPGNPLCWWVLRMQTQPEAEAPDQPTRSPQYEVLQAQVSLLPALLPAKSCALPSGTPTAPLQPAQQTPHPGVRWLPGFRAPLDELQALQQDCHARAFLRFARAVAWSKEWLGDLRYDRSPGLDFAELTLPSRGPCPRWVPPWQPPLLPFLSAGSR